MATKSVFQKFDNAILDDLQVSVEGYIGIPSSNLSVINDIALEECEDNYQRIKDILYPDVMNTAPFSTYKKKKMFVFPSCEVSSLRIKEAAKEHGIRITNDFEEADLFITHWNAWGEFSHGENISTTKLLGAITNYDLIADGTSVVKDYHDTTGQFVAHTRKLAEKYFSCSVHDNIFDRYFYTGMALRLAHRIKFESIPVYSIDDLLNSSSTLQPLTQQLLDDLKHYYSSYSSEDRNIADKIVCTIDYNTNFHFIYELAQECYSSISNSKDKDVRYWLDRSRLYSYYHMNRVKFIEHLHQNDKLTTETFKYLEQFTRRNISINNRDLYVFSVQIKPEYRKYLSIKKEKNE